MHSSRRAGPPLSPWQMLSPVTSSFDPDVTERVIPSGPFCDVVPAPAWSTEMPERRRRTSGSMLVPSVPQPTAVSFWPADTCVVRTARGATPVTGFSSTSAATSPLHSRRDGPVTISRTSYGTRTSRESTP